MGFSANAIAIRELEAEVDDIENVIRDLRDKQRSLRTQRNSNLPFFCLPPEICIAIFSLACHKGRLPKRREKIPLVTTPFVISGVCHGWRVMARSAPELWCSVSLCVRPYIEDRSQIQAELLDQWLRLAKAWPLSIVMSFDPLFNTLHAQTYAGIGNRGGMSRERFFFYGFAASTIWYLFPGYLFQALSYFSWVCWIAPDNVPVNQMFGYVHGMGMSLITFDWAQVKLSVNILPSV